MKCKICGKRMHIAHKRGQNKRQYCWICRDKKNELPIAKPVHHQPAPVMQQQIGEFIIRISVERVK